MKDKHTFAICAYKESPYLERVIKALMKQTVKSNIIMCTSTPCGYISNMAEKYDIPLYVRDGASDIRDDWNFAYDQAKTQFVTIAHQDDEYHEEYAGHLKAMIEKYDGDFLMFYSGYKPIKDGQVVTDINCRIRRFLRWPMRIRVFNKVRWIKKLTLSLGNSICCPAATYNKEQLGDSMFTSDMKFNIDWDTFYKLAKMKGRFAYVDKTLTYYRVHDGATSKEFIDNSGRVVEDTAMFEKFWPRWMAKLIMKFYKKAYDTYN